MSEKVEMKKYPKQKISFKYLKSECINRVKLNNYEDANNLIYKYIKYYNNYRIQLKQN